MSKSASLLSPRPDGKCAASERSSQKLKVVAWQTRELLAQQATTCGESFENRIAPRRRRTDAPNSIPAAGEVNPLRTTHGNLGTQSVHYGCLD